ncbi:HdeD family acid-resistance protein [Steroidobacter cummioxidans]|uniref:HdeD family acid-resistance protein n=1 Tax=Steroidobacter cummioxidans TaxID=1803913 RepID=UPI000E30FE5F|nr:HdeD family acid-resistance protein [Steroidobacter cummioxidans]
MSTLERESVPGLFPLVGRSWWMLLLYGILGVIFGLFALARPLSAATALVWAIGVLALAEGLVSLFAAFSNKVGVPKGWVALYAVLSILFGIMAVMNPVTMAGTLLLFLAAWLIVAGIYRIVVAIKVREEIKGEWLIALSGVLSIILGVLFFMSPLTGLVVAAWWIGAGAMVYGMLQILGAFKLRSLR